MVAVRSILIAGVAVAVLDIANAMTFWTLYRGTDPEIILQSVAAGLLGREAFAGGGSTALLGAFLQLFISLCISAFYYCALTVFPFINRRPFLAGSMYGIVVYLVMNHVVVPLSRAMPVPFILPWFLANFIGHIILVGLPVSYINRWSIARRISS